MSKRTQKKPTAKLLDTHSTAIEYLPVDELEPHPRQAELFSDPPEDEREKLIADIRAHGIETPLFVMSDRKTVLCGDQRRRAALQVGLETVPCIVRSDLTDPQSPEVVELMIRDNLNRRHLTPMQKVRLVEELEAIENQRRTKKSSNGHATSEPADKELVRDAVGKKLGVSGREVDRYRKIARAPKAVQQALDRGLVTVTQAEKVAGLGDKAKRKIAQKAEKVLASETDARGKKRELRAVVHGELATAKRKKTGAKGSSLKPIEQMVEFLDVQLTVMEENLEQILASLAPSAANPDFESAAESLPRSVVESLRSAHSRLTAVIRQVDQMLGRDEEEQDEDEEAAETEGYEDEEEPEPNKETGDDDLQDEDEDEDEEANVLGDEEEEEE